MKFDNKKNKGRQKKREKEHIYKATESSKKPKFYVLDMFPYPSGYGLHVGHPKGYVATDVIARMKMIQGYNVLHPMGRDAFGLPAEQYAIKNKVNPTISTAENVARYKKQLENIGFTYDRSREVNTTDPEYYKWTQWIFLKLYDHRYDKEQKKARPIQELRDQLREDKKKNKTKYEQMLAGTTEEQYIDNQRLAYVDYKPILRSVNLQTAISQEDLDENGNDERTGGPVERRPMRQWVLRITDYADRLLEGLDTLTERPHNVKEMQRNRIGRSEGTQFTMEIVSNKFSPLLGGDAGKAEGATNRENLPADRHGLEASISIYTTRIDTVYGMSYVALAPEHPLVETITTKEHKKEIEAYQKQSKRKGELQRTDLNKDKTGVFTGAYAVNPFNEEQVPIWIADYVLMDYGTGAVMAVPAHDERDFAFAKKYKLPIQYVISANKENKEQKPFTNKGILVQSGSYSGITSDQAIAAMQTRLEKKGIGGKKVTYRLQDRVFSRQRYRGEPIPMVQIDKTIVSLADKDLPLTLPNVEHYEPTGTEEGPLAAIDDRINITLPDGTKAKRESNTMPQRAGSSRYRLRYMDPKNNKKLVDPAKEQYRGQVDVYVGGMEHATRHLIYARFRHKFLYDIDAVSVSEPFKKLYGVGLVLAEDGRKMSKRRGNVINPDDVIDEYGADAFRIYEMFMGPFENEVARSTAGVKGVKKFLDKVTKITERIDTKHQDNKDILSLLHKTIKKVTEDIEHFRFNTAISQLMILVNALMDEDIISKHTIQILSIILSPFAPHLAETMRESIGNTFSIFTKATRPNYDEKLLQDETIKIAVQINGKVRGTIKISPTATQNDVMDIIVQDPVLTKRLTSEPKKIIYIQGKIVNIIL